MCIHYFLAKLQLNETLNEADRNITDNYYGASGDSFRDVSNDCGSAKLQTDLSGKRQFRT